MIATTEFPPGVAPGDEMKSRSCDELHDGTVRYESSQQRRSNNSLIRLRACASSSSTNCGALGFGSHRRSGVGIRPFSETSSS